MGCNSSKPGTNPPRSPLGSRLLLGSNGNASTLADGIKQYSIKDVKGAGISKAGFIAENPGNVSDFYDFDKRQLGEGAFGTVRMAKHKVSKSGRAAKTIKKKAVQFNQQFIQEIAITKAMDHPHIIKLYESFEDAMNYYLMMELCTGGELFDRIVDADSGFTEGHSALLAEQMCQAVHYMHGLRVAHRDLKPENFLLQSTGPLNDAVLKLIDFGLAKSFRDTPFTTAVGSACYMAPEVLAKSYGLECDVWSLGCTLYTMLCGYPPFQGDTDRETMQQVKSAKLQFPEEEWAKVSAGAKQLVQKMLRRAVKERATCEQALMDPWIKLKAPHATGQKLSSGLVGNIRAFHSQHRLKKAALHVVASNLREQQIQRLRKIFKVLDANGDGMLSREELRDGMQAAAGAGMSAEDLEVVMSGLDADGSGFIDYTEFLAAAIDQRVYEQETICWEAFSVFDRDGDGKISMEEMAQVLSGDGIEDVCGADSITALMKQCDTDGDGEIDFQEFMAMMRLSGEPQAHPTPVASPPEPEAEVGIGSL